VKKIPGLTVERPCTSPRPISRSYQKPSRGWYYSGQLGRRILVDNDAGPAHENSSLPNPMYRTSSQVASAMILENSQARRRNNENILSSPRDSSFTESLCNTKMSYPTTNRNGFSIEANDMMYRNNSFDCRMNRSRVVRDPGAWKQNTTSPYISSTSINPTLNTRMGKGQEVIGVKSKDWGKGTFKSPFIA